jgi:Core-2/I-Branching enzyme
MKFAVLIITYTSPKQTKRLITSLNNGEFDFYIHLDEKINPETHRELFGLPNVYFVEPRVNIKWGGYTTVEAALSGIRFIAASGIKYDFVNLLTGQDYPIKSAGYISDFLRKNIGSEFILFKKFNTEWMEARSRVENYHFTELPFRSRHLLASIVNRIAPKRKFPVNLELVGKETFWTLSLACAVYVTSYLDTHPKLRRFLRYTWGSDEFIFQTIIMGSPFKEKVVNHNYRFINWPKTGARPNIFVTDDFEKLMASDALFARKFDINTDENILTLLDKANGVFS